MTVEQHEHTTMLPNGHTRCTVPGGDVAAAAVIAAATMVSLTTIAGWVGWEVLRSAAWAGSLLVMAILVALVVVVRLRPPSNEQSTVAGLVLAVPALAVAVVAVAGAIRGVPDGLAWFLNGDHPRHAVYVADTWAQGNLSYAVEGYPHGWHSLLAAAWAVADAGLDPVSIIRLFQIMAIASLLLSAALALSMAHLGHALGTRLGLGGRAATSVGLAAGSATLLNVFLANYQALGYENSLLAAAVVAVCARELLVRVGSSLSVVVSASGAVVLAHAWQLLLPVVAVVALWCAREALRLRQERAVAVVVGATVGAFVFGAPAVLAVVQGVGIQHATEAGPDSPVPLVLLAMGIGSCVALGTRFRNTAVRCVATLTVIPTLLAVVLSLGLGVALLHYYPSKLLWQSALLGMPWVAAAGALLLDRLATARPGAGLVGRQVVTGVVALFVTYVLPLPWGSQVGSWVTVDASRAIAALSTPRAPEAGVVWLGGNPTTDSVTRSLLDVYRVAGTTERAPQARLTVAQECALLERAERPVVLSTEPEAKVRSRYACVPGVTVVRVDAMTP